MLDSIINNTVRPAEIILIDDGSTDDSAEIVTNYCKKYNFINYIYQKHAGVSSARNLGLSKATSEWISFLDADDYIDSDMYESMLDALENSDDCCGCVAGYYTEKDGVVTPYFSNALSTLTATEFTKAMFLDDNIRGFLFTRLFHRSLLNGITFDSNITLCEDLLFQTQLLKNNPKAKFTVLQKPFYHYIQNSSSATNAKKYFKNNTFKYRDAFEKIYSINSMDYVWHAYQQIAEYSMYTILTDYKNGNSSLIKDIRLLQKELKSIPCKSFNLHYFAYSYAPILYSKIL